WLEPRARLRECPIDLPGGLGRRRRVRLLCAVGLLKEKAHNYTEKKRRNELKTRTKQKRARTKEDRARHGAKKTTQHNEYRKPRALWTRQSMFSGSPRDDMAEISNKMPVDGHQPVQRPEIELLPPVKPEPSVMRRQPPEAGEVDVSIMARDVDISVMVDGVLPVPVVGTPTDHIEGHRHHLVDPIVI